MKNYIMYLAFIFALSCTNQDKQNTTDQNLKDIKVEKDKEIAVRQSQQQDSTNILGDKIIFSNEIDENGLTSPDTILIFKMFNDSVGNNDSLLINTHNYFFKRKGTKYIYATTELSDSVKLKNSFKEVIYKIRLNNFNDDINLPVSLIDSAYSNYDVAWFDESERILIIKPKKAYDNARMFVRLIKYNEEGFQENSITINDFQYTSGVTTKHGYMLGLNDFGHGSSRYFVASDYSYKIVWLDKDLNILEKFHVAQQSTELKSVNFRNNQFTANFEMHLGCDICDWNFCNYTLTFDNRFQPKSVKIYNQPRDLNVNSDTLMIEIVKQQSLTKAMPSKGFYSTYFSIFY